MTPKAALKWMRRLNDINVALTAASSFQLDIPHDVWRAVSEARGSVRVMQEELERIASGIVDL